MGSPLCMTEDWHAPESLHSGHIVDDFCSGEASLDMWLKRRALINQGTGASRTFVVADSRLVVAGYYAMAAGAVDHAVATGAVRRNMPDPVPVLVLARLATDLKARGRMLGAWLLRDAVLRARRVAVEAGVRAMLVHAISESARSFYLHHGFEQSRHNPMTLMLSL